MHSQKVQKKEKQVEFYEKVDEEIRKTPKEHVIIIFGYLNAQIRNEGNINEVTRKYIMHERTNENRKTETSM